MRGSPGCSTPRARRPQAANQPDRSFRACRKSAAVPTAIRLLGSYPVLSTVLAMRDFPKILIALFVSAALPHAAFATGAEPDKDLKVDPAPCLAAAAANDDDRIIAVCGGLIDNAKTAKADRLKALLARAAAHDRKSMIDSAIADYDAA